MIDIQIVGKFPTLQNDFSQFTPKAAEIMLEGVMHNFEVGGQPTWKAKKDGSPSFLGGKSGSIARALQKFFGKDFAGVKISLPYARIHDSGGTTHPTVTAAMKAHFWKVYYDSGKENEFARRMALQKLGKKLTVNIPKREYMKISSDTWRELKELFVGYVFSLKKL